MTSYGDAIRINNVNIESNYNSITIGGSCLINAKRFGIAITDS